jgi:orotidine-5'-phosphate decarboxylase
MRDRIIVALDAGSGHEALSLARQLHGHARWVKVGMTLFYAEGPSVVHALRDMGFDVFVDLKLHDIPHQVRGAARSLGWLGAGMLTVHAGGGEHMIRAALGGAGEGAREAGLAPPKVLAVTLLTSTDAATLSSLGITRSVAEQVELLGGVARHAGADGLVCSPREARAMRDAWGSEALVVTPGVRPAGSAADDQSRVMTPAEAIAQGASHLVIGRPVTAASDPAHAFESILATMEGAA